MRYIQTFLLNLIILLFAPASLFAGPVLICDPSPVTELQPTKFVVVLDDVAHDVLPEQYPDGSSRLRYDLGEIADGVHSVKAKAVNSVVKSVVKADSALPLESAWVAISFRKTGSQIVRIKDEAEKLPPTRTFKGYLRDER
ncbi:MAG TPA: hypothetical protein VLX12_03075 [Syntrophorhabdales bacterium]|nr:hypothetical protein [Syntrophorhabdales bacterium]